MQTSAILTLGAALAAMNAGCATILNDDTRMVTVSSNPPGAQFAVDGRPAGVTPATVPVANSTSHQIVVQASGYAPQACYLESSVGAGWVILDIVLGLLPVIVDAATGDWRSLQQTSCFINLAPAAAPVPAAPPAPAAPPGV